MSIVCTISIFLYSDLMDGIFSKKLKRSITSLVIFAVILCIVTILKLPQQQPPSSPLSPVPQSSVMTTLPDIRAGSTSTQIASASAVLGSSSREKATVLRVVDGDTVVLTDGRKLRYIGIDTPETVKPGVAPECFGHEASLKNKELVEGKQIEMEKDVSEVDRYGRLLRLVYVGDIFVNDAMVREGYAYASTYPPDVKYSEQFKDAERDAQTHSAGLWAASCPVHKGDKI